MSGCQHKGVAPDSARKITHFNSAEIKKDISFQQVLDRIRMEYSFSECLINFGMTVEGGIATQLKKYRKAFFEKAIISGKGFRQAYLSSAIFPKR